MPSRAALELLVKLRDEASAAMAKLDTNSAGAEAAVNKLVLAQRKAEDAALALAKAESKLADNTDPTKQRDLETAVMRARVALGDAAEKADKMAQSVEHVGESADRGGNMLGKLQTAVTGIRDAMEIADRVVQAVGKAYEMTAGKAAEYARKVRDAMKATGQSAEQASQVLGGPIMSQAQLDSTLRMSNATEKLDAAINKLAITVGNAVAPAIANLADNAALLLDPMQRLQAAYIEHNDVMLKSASTYEIYANEMDRSAKAINGSFDAQGNLIDSSGQLLVANLKLSEGQWNLAHGVDVARVSIEDEEKATRRGIEASDRAAASTQARADAELRAAENSRIAFGLQAGLSGQLASANDSWSDSTQDLAAKAKDLDAEIAKLEKGNHTYITSTKKAEAGTGDLADAQLRQEIASRKLADAQTKLATNTDTGKIRDLETSVMSAQLAYNGATDAVNRASGATDENTRVLINNDAEIAKKRDELNQLNISLAENAAAHQQATAKIVLGYEQQAMARLGIDDPRLELEMARATKQLSQADYDLQMRLLDLTQAYKDKLITGDELVAGMKEEADAAALGTTPAMIAYGQAMDKANQSLATMRSGQDVQWAYGQAQGADAMATSYGNVATSIDAVNRAYWNAKSAAEQFAGATSRAGASGQEAGQAWRAAYGHAGGGPEYAGVPSWVGEHGPEPFVPATNGYTLSRTDAMQALGASAGISVTVMPGAVVIQGGGEQAGKAAARGFLDELASRGQR